MGTSAVVAEEIRPPNMGPRACKLPFFTKRTHGKWINLSAGEGAFMSRYLELMEIVIRTPNSSRSGKTLDLEFFVSSQHFSCSSESIFKELSSFMGSTHATFFWSFLDNQRAAIRCSSTILFNKFMDQNFRVGLILFCRLFMGLHWQFFLGS